LDPPYDIKLVRGAYSAPSDPLAVFRGLLRRERREREKRQEGGGGSSSLAHRKRKENWASMSNIRKRLQTSRCVRLKNPALQGAVTDMIIKPTTTTTAPF